MSASDVVAGAAAERKAAVVWLRAVNEREAEGCPEHKDCRLRGCSRCEHSWNTICALHSAARAIERGDHMNKDGGA